MCIVLSSLCIQSSLHVYLQLCNKKINSSHTQIYTRNLHTQGSFCTGSGNGALALCDVHYQLATTYSYTLVATIHTYIHTQCTSTSCCSNLSALYHFGHARMKVLCCAEIFMHTKTYYVYLQLCNKKINSSHTQIYTRNIHTQGSFCTGSGNGALALCDVQGKCLRYFSRY